MNTRLQPIIKNVLNLKTFSPSKEVDAVMSALVNGVVETPSMLIAGSVTAKQKSKVRHISARTESELEKYWADRIVNSTKPLRTLSTFPYLDNYEELTVREVDLLAKTGLVLSKNHKALIIGSGPLPLSAYELYCRTGVRVDHVDSSRQAIGLCQSFMKQLGIVSKYYHSVGEMVELEGDYDLILIAALAGDTAMDKQKIINRVLPHLSNNGRIILRSARGSRTLLYPAIKSNDIQGVHLLEEYHPTDYIINSVFVYGK
ncbi:MAG: nicotianamine synthase family protein [Candidatus Microsaccharimonas sp.]